MSPVLSLYRLQQIDSQLDRVKSRLQANHKVLEDDAEVKQAQQFVTSSETRYQTAGTVLKQAEGNVENQLIKIEQTQASLYGKNFHSPKELQDLQNDLTSLKNFLTTLEDRQLDAMQEVESAEGQLKDAQYKSDSVRSSWTEKNKIIIKEQQSLNNELDRLLVERNAVAETLPTSEIGMYDQLRQTRRGVAVALIDENSCGACGTTLSLAQVQSARSSSRMVNCPSCGRILYAS